jgi:hypothetical protein
MALPSKLPRQASPAVVAPKAGKVAKTSCLPGELVRSDGSLYIGSLDKEATISL